MDATEFCRIQSDGVGWKVTQHGVFVEGSGIERTPGPPRTVSAIRNNFDAAIGHAAAESGVPVEILVAVAATESGGRADAVAVDPGFQDEFTTPQRIRSGLMLTRLSTAREALQQSVGAAALADPVLSARAAALRIAAQSSATRLDPVLVAAAYNSGSLSRQNSPNNRWRLRQYPLGTSQYVDRFVRFYNDAVAVSRLPSLPVTIGRSTAEVRFASSVAAARVPGFALAVLRELLRVSGNPRAVVTSTLRNPDDQARVMYANCLRHGPESQLKLYGAPGRAVVREFIAARDAGLSAEAIVSRMRDAIVKQGPYSVSHHAGDPNKLAVLDIAPSSLNSPTRFIAAARTDRRISKTLIPPQDPAIHLEIPLTSTAV
ncbi:MAG: hypothetical protein AMXMBFR47_32280 [Planctomycetota bacterium]